MSENYEHEDHGGGGGRWGGRTWTLIGALIVVLIIAGAGIWLVTRDDDDGGETSSTTTLVGSTSAPTTMTPGSLLPVEQLPDGFVGGREVIDGLPVGFPHDQAGAISAGAVWTSYLFICPYDQRPEGLSTIMTPDAPELALCGGGPTSPSVAGQTALAVRGSMTGDSGVLEYLTMGSYDFLDQLGWQLTAHVVTLTLTWSPDENDWRITTWSRRDLFDSEAPEVTPELLAGFQWLRPIGASLTSTALVSGE